MQVIGHGAALAIAVLLPVADAISADRRQATASALVDGRELVGQLEHDGILDRLEAPWRGSSLRLSAKETKHFGDTKCPCIGFDGIAGETLVAFEDGRNASYPADLGARCEAWDDDHHPECKDGAGPDFCKQQWCYVDSCNCDLPVLPKPSTYVPDAIFRGRNIFFSYATCGGKDMWSKELPQAGTVGCRCIGFGNIPGTMVIKAEGPGGKAMNATYPAELGGSCKAWDHDAHPMCLGENAPAWCHQRWCYVDPCSCDLSEPPKVTMYLPEASSTGMSLYYSYETCGAKDYFTKDFSRDACVNQMSKEDCLRLWTPEGHTKCAWAKGACVGWEIVEHPLCKKAVTFLAHADKRSFAPRCFQWPVVVFSLLAAALWR
mmetsp:Transcript_50978/g.147104  ORF Transcript_50978/g.147104 Transcript_50978/m.147104 type:complete len:376 (+) Transcript_50978:92-1219(+)